MLLHNTIARVKQNKLFYETGEQARKQQNMLIKPKGSLGKLEDISIKLAEITGQVKYNICKKEVIIFCGDHGFAEHGVSAYPPEVTRQMTKAYLKGTAAASVIAKANGAGLTVIDIGIKGNVEDHRLIKRKIREGTCDFTKGPAMTNEELVAAIEAGISETENIIKKGAHIIALGEMGIGNTTSSSALLAVYGSFTPEKVVGRGSLVNNETMERKIRIIKEAIKINKPIRKNPLDVLAKLGGFEIAGMVGAFLACAANRTPVVVDGFIASIAAITAKLIAPGCERYMFASHLSKEPAHIYMLEMLDLDPLLDLDMRLGEATGASLAMQLIQSASKVICEMDTFYAGGVTESDKRLEHLEKITLKKEKVCSL